MKISIFPKSKALPESKEEKSKEAWYTSKPHYPEVIDVATSEQLIETVCNSAWSPSVFNGYRNQKNFLSTDFIVLDIDEKMTIDEAEKVVHKLDIATLCLPTTSHSEEHHKFRLIFPLARSINNKLDFSETMLKLAEHFPADPACLSDTGRFFFGSKMVDGFWFDSDLLVPTPAEKPRKGEIKQYEHKDNIVVGDTIKERVEALYGEPRVKVPEGIAYFLENAPNNLSGEWFRASNSFLFSCGLAGLDQDKIREIFYSLYPHDELTEYKVDKMIQDGFNSREEEL